MKKRLLEQGGIWAVTALLLFNIPLWYAVADISGQRLFVAFLDIGQGDAIFIETPSGHQMLVDGGPGDAVLRELSKVMPFYDRSIDVVVATHPDADHIGGLPGIFEAYDVSMFLEPGVESDTGVYKALTKAVHDEGITPILARRGMTLSFSDGAMLTILFPDRDTIGWETNTASIVAKLTFGETEFLLTGDSPEAIEHYLVSLDGAGLESEVLKLGHHGSKTSSSEEFLATISPEYAVISAGKDNRYGHPHKEVTDLLAKLGIPSFNTAERGIIRFVTDGRQISLK